MSEPEESTTSSQGLFPYECSPWDFGKARGSSDSDSICFDKLFFFAPLNLGWLSEFSIASCDTA